MIKKYFPFIIILLLHIAGFVYASQTLNIYLKDSFEYLHLAKNLVSDFTIYSGDLQKPFLPQLVSLRPPVYGAFIAITKITGLNNFVVVFAQGILSLLTILLLLKTLSHLFKTNYNYFIAAAFLFFPSQIVYANMIMSEILFQFFILLFVYLHILYFQIQKPKYLVFTCICMCFMLLTKPVSLFILVFYTLFILIQIIKTTLDLSVMAFPVIAFICLLSYQFYNYEKTGYFHYSSITSTYLLNYQLLPVLNECTTATSDMSPQEAIDRINALAENESTFKSYSKKRISLTLEELQNNPGAFIRLTSFGIFTFFIDRGKWDVSEFLISKHHENNRILSIYMWFVLFFKIIVFALFLYSLTLIKNGSNTFLLILFIILAVAIATGLTGSARFHLPIYPLVLILSVLSLQNPKLKQFTENFKCQPRF